MEEWSKAEYDRRSVQSVRTRISDDHVLVTHVDAKRGQQRPVFRGELNRSIQGGGEVNLVYMGDQDCISHTSYFLR